MQADFSSMLSSLLPASLPGPMARAAARILGLEEAERTYRALREMETGEHLAERLLGHLEVTYRASDEDLDRIPRTGAAIVMANHPTGILDGAVLATLLRRIRPDVRFLANEALALIPELQDLIIAVDPFEGRAAARANHRAIRAVLDHLQAGGMIVTFPAGEVSHLQLRERCVTDSEWRKGLARILAMAARRACAPAIVPVHVGGANGFSFQAGGLVHPAVRTALLARELWNKRRAKVDVRIGKAIPAERVLAIPDDSERMQYLRWRTYLLAKRMDFKPRTRMPLGARRRSTEQQPVAAAISSDDLAAEVARLGAERKLVESGDLCVYLAEASQLPRVLDEIGRLRELTFRAVGEGTGQSRDLDRFDAHYLHLFVWNLAKREVVGAYRLAGSEVTGRGDLYTATLFHFGEEFLQALGPALELGRSFVRQEYQKSFAPLLLLWKAIGRYVAANPRYRRLFGPVSISNSYQSISRELMIGFLEKSASLSDWTRLVRARNSPARAAEAVHCRDIDELSELVSDLEPGGEGVPVLLRQYLRLGGKLLGFNVDPEFSNTLDGLIVVDLMRTERKLLDRYLGRQEAQRFVSAQEAVHGTFEGVHRC